MEEPEAESDQGLSGDNREGQRAILPPTPPPERVGLRPELQPES